MPEGVCLFILALDEQNIILSLFDYFAKLLLLVLIIEYRLLVFRQTVLQLLFFHAKFRVTIRQEML